MKKSIEQSITICLAAITIFSCKRMLETPSQQTATNSATQSASVTPNIKLPAHKANQLIVAWKNPPTAQQIKRVKSAISANINEASIRTRKCNSCTDSYVELWEAPRIETTIRTEGVSAGSSSRAKGVGEDSLASYSLNFLTKSIDPAIKPPNGIPYRLPARPVFQPSTKNPTVVALIDTGVDTFLIPSKYLWTNPKPTSCYPNSVYGWNFTLNDPHLNNADVHDDNVIRHGTVISRFIINEFAQSAYNRVQLMVLKTLDKNGGGDLFTNICAIHFAMNNGANIINASWGFYYHGDSKLTYLDSLITKILPSRRILFIAAAGNMTREEDDLARLDGITEPRNLSKNKFFPACLSSIDNNVITVTTADLNRVSLTQNYSPVFVDLGIMPDLVIAGGMKFNIPYPFIAQNDMASTISGSSFATAIATGIIGAHLKKDQYVSGMKKTPVLNSLLSSRRIRYQNTLTKYIRKGGHSTHSVNSP